MNRHNSKEGLNMKRFFISLCASSLVLLATASLSMAADYGYKTMTPDIEKALKNRQSRYHLRSAVTSSSQRGELLPLRSPKGDALKALF